MSNRLAPERQGPLEVSIVRKISFLMAFLITGYILGIWNFLVLPKYYITFGIKYFLIGLSSYTY